MSRLFCLAVAALAAASCSAETGAPLVQQADTAAKFPPTGAIDANGGTEVPLVQQLIRWENRRRLPRATRRANLQTHPWFRTLILQKKLGHESAVVARAAGPVPAGESVGRWALAKSRYG